MELLVAVSQGSLVLGDTLEVYLPKSISETAPDVSDQVSVHKCHGSRLAMMSNDIALVSELSACYCKTVNSVNDSNVDNLEEKVDHHCRCRQHTNQSLRTESDHDCKCSLPCVECKSEVNNMVEETVQRPSLVSNSQLALNLCVPSEKQTLVKRMVSFSTIGQKDEEQCVTDKPKQSLLLRLFESKLFNMSIAIQYLFNSKETGVLSYLGTLFHLLVQCSHVLAAGLHVFVGNTSLYNNPMLLCIVCKRSNLENVKCGHF